MGKHRQLTEKIQQIAKEKLGYEITIKELRFMPYIQYVMVNEQRIDPRKIIKEEKSILSEWRRAGYIGGDVGGNLTITKQFWDIISDIIFEGYVDID